MDDKIKRYLDRVVMEIVSSTKIDYNKEIVTAPFHPNFQLDEPRGLFNWTLSRPFVFSSNFFLFSKYCNNLFGLTKEEVEYVWNEYNDIITDKIINEQPNPPIRTTNQINLTIDCKYRRIKKSDLPDNLEGNFYYNIIDHFCEKYKDRDKIRKRYNNRNN